MMHYVYIIECINGHYYTGYTTNVSRRFQEHQTGINCKYTRAFPPRELLAVWTFENKSDALRFECQMKLLSKKQKLTIIEEKNSVSALLM